MNLINRLAVVSAVLGLVLYAAAPAFAAEQPVSAQGYSIQLHDNTIDLTFPDGSVLHTPRDADPKTLAGVTASGGGMAQQLLDQANTELGGSQAPELPKAFELAQNYPNPFNPSTTIMYSLPEGNPQVQVNLTVFNIRGQVVRTLVDESKGAGQYSVNWNGTDSEGRQVSSGIYFYRILAGNYHATRKMVILK